MLSRMVRLDSAFVVQPPELVVDGFPGLDICHGQVAPQGRHGLAQLHCPRRRRPTDVAQAVDRVIRAARDIQVVGAVPVVRRGQDICPPAVMEPCDAELDFADGVLRAVDEKLVIDKQRNTSLRWICPRAVFASPPILAHAENRCTKFRRNSEKFFCVTKRPVAQLT